MGKPLDLSKPVQLSNGEKAKVIYTERKGTYPIVVLVGVREDAMSCTRSGEMGGTPHLRLVNVPDKRSVFFALYIPNEHGEESPSRRFIYARQTTPGLNKAVGYPTLKKALAENTSFSDCCCDIIEVMLEDDVVVGTKLHPGKGALANRNE